MPAIGVDGVTLSSNTGSRGAGDDILELSLKMYSGEVLTAYEQNNIARGTIMTKPTQGAKSEQFPILGTKTRDSSYNPTDASVQTHRPGDTITVDPYSNFERTIEIQGREYTSFQTDDWVEKVKHFETRSIYSMDNGLALANKVDRTIFSQIHKAVQGLDKSGSILTDLNNVNKASQYTKVHNVGGVNDGFITIGDETVVGAGAGVTTDDIKVSSAWNGLSSASKGDAFKDAIFRAQTSMKEADMYSPKILVTTPRGMEYLSNGSTVVNADFSKVNYGALDTMNVGMVAGLPTLVTNNLPSSIGSQDGVVLGYVYSMNIVGMLELMSVTTETNYLPKELSWLTTSYLAYGIDTLNPVAGIGIAYQNTPNA